MSGYAEPYDSMYLALLYSENGNHLKALDLLDKVSASDSDRYMYTRDFVRYRLCKDLGLYKEALDELEKADAISELKIKSRLAQSLSSSVIDYINDNHQKTKSSLRSSRIITLLVIVSAALSISLMLILVFYVRERHRKEIKEKNEYADQLLSLLKESKEESGRAQASVNTLFSSKNSLLEDLCSIMAQNQDTPSTRKKIANMVTDLIKNFSIDSGKVEELERQADILYGNLYTEFRNDLPDLKAADYHLFLFCIHKFSNTAIALFLNSANVTSVYNRKRRLKDKIKQLEGHKAEKYLQFL